MLFVLAAIVCGGVLFGLVVPLVLVIGACKLVPDIVVFDRFELRAVVAMVAVFAYLFGSVRLLMWHESRLRVPSARARYRRRG